MRFRKNIQDIFIRWRQGQTGYPVILREARRGDLYPVNSVNRSPDPGLSGRLNRKAETAERCINDAVGGDGEVGGEGFIYKVSQYHLPVHSPVLRTHDGAVTGSIYNIFVRPDGVGNDAPYPLENFLKGGRRTALGRGQGLPGGPIVGRLENSIANPDGPGIGTDVPVGCAEHFPGAIIPCVMFPRPFVLRETGGALFCVGTGGLAPDLAGARRFPHSPGSAASQKVVLIIHVDGNAEHPSTDIVGPAPAPWLARSIRKRRQRCNIGEFARADPRGDIPDLRVPELHELMAGLHGQPPGFRHFFLNLRRGGFAVGYSR